MQNNGSTHNPLGDIDPFIVTEAAIQARLIELDKEINEAFEERDVAGVAITVSYTHLTLPTKA